MESKNLAQNNNHIYIYIYIYIIYTYTIYIQMFKTMERLSFAPRHKDVQWWFCHRCYNIYICLCYGRLQWGGGMRAGRNIPFIQTFSEI